MNRSTLRSRIRGYRFDAAGSQDTDINDAIDRAYAWVWYAAEWRFRFVRDALFSLVKGTQSYNPYPTFRAEVLDVFDDEGDALQRVEFGEFRRLYTAGQLDGVQAYPEAYAVDNDMIYVGPTPDANREFSIDYERRVCHYQSDGSTITAGLMDEDTDLPFWSADHHGILVPTAAVIMLGTEEDDRVAGLEKDRDQQLAAMIGRHGPDRHVPMQYGGG